MFIADDFKRFLHIQEHVIPDCAGGKFSVWLKVGVQSFQITSSQWETKDEAERMCNWFCQALANMVEMTRAER